MLSESKLQTFLNDLKLTIERRKDRLTPAEFYRITDEVDYACQIIHECTNVSDLGRSISEKFGGFYMDPTQCLLRIHEIAAVGAFSSCLTSLPIAKALFLIGAFNRNGANSPNTIVGRGHIAPVFYALRHLRGGFPLCFLAAVHEAVPAIVNQEWGFSNTMRHSLGEGLPMVVGQALLGPDTDACHICVVGDGELDEGVSLESMRIAQVQDVQNMIVIIDDNETGIEQQPRALNQDYLKSVFVQVFKLNMPTADTIAEYIKLASLRRERTAIVCKSIKGPHSFVPLAGKKKQSQTTCAAVAGIIRDFRSQYNNVHVLTADLASRFGFKNKSEYVNVGLSEASSIGMTMALPKDDIKFVVTDDKYLLNSIDILLSAMSCSRNLHVIAARKNTIWGGHTCTPSIFSSIIDGEVHELVDPVDLAKVICAAINRGENGLYLMNDQPEETIESMRGAYKLLGSKILYKCQEKSDTLVITAESMASRVFDLMPNYYFSHLRVLTRRPDISADIKNLIYTYKKLIVIEYGEARAGLAEYLETQIEFDLVSITRNGYEAPCVNAQHDVLLCELIEYLKPLERINYA